MNIEKLVDFSIECMKANDFAEAMFTTNIANKIKNKTVDSIKIELINLVNATNISPAQAKIFKLDIFAIVDCMDVYYILSNLRIDSIASGRK